MFKIFRDLYLCDRNAKLDRVSQFLITASYFNFADLLFRVQRHYWK